ncbi:MAG: F0F1 ATP synthase B subunit [Candidatus Scalindua rubra]|uniref:ATP synthase subunit b n=1 Tax=Candidatus Scalindua rubra TaxID=1872076 RepID=A0A1E3X6B0_9BACT|nr:MAG: F0F1 ATP synthase B subunit [Candidatus Scalindua rubra]
MPQFDLHFLTPLTFWSIISFIILMAILYKYALPAITEILDSRQKTIIDEIDRAEKLRKDAEKTLAEYQEKLQYAFQKSEEVVNDAVKKAEEIHQKKLYETNAEKEKILSDARKTIEFEKDKALIEIRTHAVYLTIAATEKLTRKTLTDADSIRLAEESIEDVFKTMR